MSKTIIVFGSTTGNCETMAGTIKSIIVDAELKNVTDCEVAELVEYDTILLGSSTWGDGELQDDIIDFEKSLTEIDLTDKKAGTFGCGDSDGWADTFCDAVDILEKKLKDCGAEIVVDGFKADGDVDDTEDALKEWAGKFV